MAAARPARYTAALAVALLAAYVVVWAHVGATDIGRSDFTSTYVGGTLLREGHRGDLYSDALQAAVHSRLVAPDRIGNLPFVNAPMAALLAAPVTLLGLDVAYRLWGLLQLMLLVVAVLVAMRSAPWPRDARPAWRVAAACTALAGAGTFALLMQAQWSAVSALGLALAYREWRHDRMARGGALLVASAAIAKPHLALALLAFMLGWRARGLVKGVVIGGLAAASASVVLVGPAGIAGFFQMLTSSATRWDLDTFVSFIGLPGAILGNTAAAQAAGIAGSVLACTLAFWLGALVRRDTTRLEPALAGASVLTLLASPHALLHDLVLLAPVAVWSLAYAIRHAQTARPMTEAAVALGSWALVSVAGLASLAGGALALAHGGALPPGVVVTPALIACAVVAALATRKRDRSLVAHRALADARLAKVS